MSPRHRIHATTLLVLSTLSVLAPWSATLQAQRALSIRDALALAAQRNPQLQLAAATLDRGIADRNLARADLLNRLIPTIRATASANRLLQNQFDALGRRFTSGVPVDSGAPPAQPNPLEAVFGARLASTYQLEAAITPLDFGRASNRYAAARAGAASTALGVTSMRAQLALDVIVAYADAQLGDAFQQVSDSAAAQSARALRVAQVGFELGRRAEFDVVRARSAAQSDLATLAQSRTAALVAMQRLRMLIGAAPDESVVLSDSAEALLTLELTGTDGLGEHIGRDVVAVSQATLEVEAQRANLRAARAERWPVVSATLTAQRFGYPAVRGFGWGTTFPNTTAGIAVSLPIDLAGRTSATIRAAAASVVASTAQLALARQAATLDRLMATGERENAAVAYSASRAAADEAERAFRIAEIRYREGQSSQIELTDARVARARAFAARARAARDLRVADAHLALLPALPMSNGGTTMFSAQPRASTTPGPQP